MASTTSGTASNANNGRQDLAAFNVWTSDKTLPATPQSVTLDLGVVKPDVGYIGYVPPYSVANKGPANVDMITQYGILVSTDGTKFTEVTSGMWASDSKMKTATFGPVSARYVRLEARASTTGAAGATEITVGAKR